MTTYSTTTRGVRIFLSALLTIVSACSVGKPTETDGSDAAEATISKPTSTSTSVEPAGAEPDPVWIDGSDLFVASCTWTWFGEYRIDADWVGDEPVPNRITFRAVLDRITGGDLGFTADVPNVTVDGADRISFVVNQPVTPYANDSIHTWQGDRMPEGEPCQVTVQQTRSEWLSTETAFDPPSDAAPGSLQALAATADRPNAPMLALASLLAQVDEPPFDRLYVSADDDLATMELSETGTCVIITQNYQTGPEVDGLTPQVSVVQERGCRPDARDPSVVTVDDPNWIVSVFGAPTEAERIADSLVRYDVAGVQPVTGSQDPGAAAFLDAWIAEQADAVEITRFAHRDGVVLAFHRETGGRESVITNTIAFGTPPGVDRARPTLECNGYTSAFSDGREDGYAWFATSESTTTIDVRLLDGTFRRMDRRTRSVMECSSLRLTEVTSRSASKTPGWRSSCATPTVARSSALGDRIQRGLNPRCLGHVSTSSRRSFEFVTIDVSAWSGVRLDRRLDGGHRNEVWSGWSLDGRVAIRRSRRTPDSLTWEVDLLGELGAVGFIVPTPRRTDGGAVSSSGVVVHRWIEGREPRSNADWTLVAEELRRLHAVSAGHQQRPGCCVVTELDRAGRSVDADLSILPDDVAGDVLSVFATVGDVDVSVVHGDPGPSNVRITGDGRVGLLDWDESRVDVVHHDLSNLGIQVLSDERHARALALSDAWEAANAWHAEPEYARIRLRALRARRSTS